MPKLLKNTPGIVIETIGFDGDHLYMVMVIPPKYAVSQIMGKLKSQSASALRKKFCWLEKVFWKENIVWSPGYFVSSIGLDEDVVRRYVEHQGKEDSGQIRMNL